MVSLTVEEIVIKAAILERIKVLRDQIVVLEREAAAHQRAAQMQATEALKLSGGVAELETLASGIVPAPDEPPVGEA